MRVFVSITLLLAAALCPVAFLAIMHYGPEWIKAYEGRALAASCGMVGFVLALTSAGNLIHRCTTCPVNQE